MGSGAALRDARRPMVLRASQDLVVERLVAADYPYQGIVKVLEKPLRLAENLGSGCLLAGLDGQTGLVRRAPCACHLSPPWRTSAAAPDKAW